MKETIINLSLNYVTNFQPNVNFTNKTKLSQTKKKIFLKNFLIFSLLMKSVSKNKFIKIFIKPKYNNVLTILRAPYKNKISRHQITLSRYFINISYKYQTKILNFHSLHSVCFFVKSFKDFFTFFETNLCYQHKSRVRVQFYNNDFFKYSF